jgi:hypothetical protein
MHRIFTQSSRSPIAPSLPPPKLGVVIFEWIEGRLLLALEKLVLSLSRRHLLDQLHRQAALGFVDARLRTLWYRASVRSMRH